MLARPQQKDQAGLYYYQGVLGAPLIGIAEKISAQLPLSVKLGFLFFLNVEMMKIEHEDALRQGVAVNRAKLLKENLSSLTAGVATVALTSAMENYGGWFMAPIVMAGGKALYDVLQEQQPREQLRARTTELYQKASTNVSSWWNRNRPQAPIRQEKSPQASPRVTIPQVNILVAATANTEKPATEEENDDFIHVSYASPADEMEQTPIEMPHNHPRRYGVQRS